MEEESRKLKRKISAEEMAYVSHLLTVDNKTPKQVFLVEIAEKLYGKKVKELHASPTPSSNLHVSGEKVLTVNSLEYLKYDMECCQNAITQLAFNMSKLAGESL